MSSLSKSLNATASANSVDYSLLCIGLNVKGGKVKSTTSNSCEIEKGVVVGTAKPGDTLSAMIDIGSNYTLELYGFLRSNATTSCPQIGNDVWTWPKDKTYLLGRVSGVTITPPETAISLPITIPASSNNLIVSAGLSTSCLGDPASNNKYVGRVLVGSAVLNGSSYTVSGQVSFKEEQSKLIGTYYNIQNGNVSFK